MKYLLAKQGFQKILTEVEFKTYLIKTEPGAVWMKEKDDITIFIEIAKRIGYEVYKSV